MILDLCGSFERSTRAHNTVTVDAENSGEVWASFRVWKEGQCFRV